MNANPLDWKLNLWKGWHLCSRLDIVYISADISRSIFSVHKGCPSIVNWRWFDSYCKTQKRESLPWMTMLGKTSFTKKIDINGCSCRWHLNLYANQRLHRLITSRFVMTHFSNVPNIDSLSIWCLRHTVCFVKQSETWLEQMIGDISRISLMIEGTRCVQRRIVINSMLNR